MALFPTDLPEREWVEFPAEGFSTPVTGVIHRRSYRALCGMPLGGLDTGCLDLDTGGLDGVPNQAADRVVERRQFGETNRAVRGSPTRPVQREPHERLARLEDALVVEAVNRDVEPSRLKIRAGEQRDGRWSARRLGIERIPLRLSRL